MYSQLPPSENMGGVGEQVIRFEDFKAFWPEELWNRGWVTHVWKVMLSRAEMYRLILVPDLDNHPKTGNKAITVASFASAQIRAWEVPGERPYKKGLGAASIALLRRYQQALQ